MSAKTSAWHRGEVSGTLAPNNAGVRDAPRDNGQPTCHYHPQRVAYVRCGACDKPLCPECIQHGPVGTRCIECLLGIAIGPVSRARRLAAGAAGMATGLAVACALGCAGLLTWFTGIGVGLAVGHVTKVVARRTALPSLQAAGGMAAAIGAYCGAVAWQASSLLRAGARTGAAIGTAMSGVSLGEWALPGLLAAGVAIYWIRRQ